MSTSVADFKVLSDGVVNNNFIDISDVLRSDEIDITRSAVLAFNANPSEDVDDLDYSIWIVRDWLPAEILDIAAIGYEGAFGYPHDTYVCTHGRFNSGVKRGMWETLNTEHFSSDPGDRQSIEHPEFDPRTGRFLMRLWFIVGGDGRPNFSDVVLWFHRRVAEAA